MTIRRTITVTLTEAEYGALAGAVSIAENEWLEMANDAEAPGGGFFGREVKNLDRAWRKLSGAWHARERRAA